jgi:hypothetical protein
MSAAAPLLLAGAVTIMRMDGAQFLSNPLIFYGRIPVSTFGNF